MSREYTLLYSLKHNCLDTCGASDEMTDRTKETSSNGDTANSGDEPGLPRSITRRRFTI